MSKAAIYIRVSTEKQELDNQLRDLEEYCKKQNWKIHKVYSDVVTGKETKEERRPGFTSLFADAHKKKFDVVLFWELSRFSRAGTLYTLQKLTELRNLGIDWVSYQEPYISSLGQFSDIIISVMSTLAKIEREKISERTKAGLRRAIAQGKKLGRPRIPAEDRVKVLEMLNKGFGVREIARTLRISPATVCAMRKRFVQKRGARKSGVGFDGNIL